MSETTKESAVRQICDLVICAHHNLQYPDAGGKKYFLAERQLGEAHRLIPKALNEINKLELENLQWKERAEKTEVALEKWEGTLEAYGLEPGRVKNWIERIASEMNGWRKCAEELAGVLSRYSEREDISHEPGIINALEALNKLKEEMK